MLELPKLDFPNSFAKSANRNNFVLLEFKVQDTALYMTEKKDTLNCT